MLGSLLGVALLSAACAVAAGASIPIVRDGRAVAQIVVRADAPQVGPERTAAAELQRFVKEMSGAVLPIRSTEDAEPGTKIIILLKPGTPHPRHDGYWLHVADGNVIIQATQPRGCLYGAYALLRELGCRWYSPGPVGTVIPRRTTLSVGADLDIRREPDFRYRLASGLGPETAARLGYNYVGVTRNAEAVEVIKARGLVMFRWGHMWPELVTKQFFADGRKPQAMDFSGREDWLPMDVKGQRKPNGRTLCFSNPDALAWFADNAVNWLLSTCAEAEYVSIWPADRASVLLCKCPKCRSRNLSATDWYLLTHREIRKRLNERGWKGRLSWIAYHGTRMPPVSVDLPDNGRNMDLLYAPRERGGTRAGPFTADDPNTARYRQWLDGWLAYLDRQHFQGTKTVFEYYYDLVLLGPLATGRAFLIPRLSVMQEDIAFYRDKGFDGFYNCNPPARTWWPDPLSKWIYAELLWDVDLDLEAAVSDFFANYYGPAASVMRKAREGLEQLMFAPPSREAVEKLEALSEEFDRALRMVAGDKLRETRIKAARLHAQYAALCKKSEYLERVAKDYAGAIEAEKAIAKLMQDNKDFLVGTGLFGSAGDVRFVGEYVVNRHLRALQPKAKKK